MRQINKIIIHCTATPEGRVVTAADIRQWHMAPKPEGRGWSKVGYSDLIGLDGALIGLHPFDTNDTVEPWEVTNGVRGFNGVARHVVYAGGCDADLKSKDTRTAAQVSALCDYVRYMILRHPSIQVAGHYQFNDQKDCPCFDVPIWLKSIGVPQKNIFYGHI